jgi:hypothetical protein
MCSSDIRLGAWDYLKWKHVIPRTNDKGEIVAAKLIVYAEEYDEYFSFITPEAYFALKEWMDSLLQLCYSKETNVTFYSIICSQCWSIKLLHVFFSLQLLPPRFFVS